MKRTAMSLAVAATMAMALGAQQKTLDFETYRTKVEPIFVKHRGVHARCSSCHTASASNLKLEPLAPGVESWTEEQSRKNFAVVSKLVVPGDPSKSRLLMHPLAPEAGGDDFHGGGHQFKTKDDPDWQVIAAWVSAAK